MGPSSNINVGGGPHSNLTSGPHSNLNISTGGPHSNLGPQSNLNPLSVQNPQSVQPHSVKSGGISEEASKEAPHKDSPGGQYQNALDNFNNVYYEIEERLACFSDPFLLLYFFCIELSFAFFCILLKHNTHLTIMNLY